MMKMFFIILGSQNSKRRGEKVIIILQIMTMMG